MYQKLRARTSLGVNVSDHVEFIPPSLSLLNLLSRKLSLSTSIGTHAMPLSDMTIFSSGKREGIPANSQSVAAANALISKSAAMTGGGESFDGTMVCDDEPTCRFTTVLVSAQAAKNGSHLPEYSESKPKASGFSLKLTALKPRSAFRLISSAAMWGRAAKSPAAR